jgi:hypothetical protein
MQSALSATTMARYRYNSRASHASKERIFYIPVSPLTYPYDGENNLLDGSIQPKSRTLIVVNGMLDQLP